MIYQQINEYEGGEYSFFPDQSTHDLFELAVAAYKLS